MAKITQDIFRKHEYYLQNSQWLEQYGVLSGFSTRLGGVSVNQYASLNLSYTVGDLPESVLRNRHLLADAIGVDLSQWVFAAQAHTNNICEVTRADCGKGMLDFESGIPDVDGMYTKDKGIVLATFHADCTPLYFHAPKHGLIGVVHAGWQGTVREIAAVFVQKWYELGVPAADIFVVIGPSPAQQAYYVGSDVVAQVQMMQCPQATQALIALDNDQYKMDTAYLNQLVLEYQGIPRQNIQTTSYCTMCDNDLLYSFRKEGSTGRMLAFITQ